MNTTTQHNIAELDLSVRSYNALVKANIRTIERLRGILLSPSGEERLLQVRGLGEKSLEEIKESLVKKGYLHPTPISFTYRMGELLLELMGSQHDNMQYIRVLQTVIDEAQTEMLLLQKHGIAKREELDVQ